MKAWWGTCGVTLVLLVAGESWAEPAVASPCEEAPHTCAVAPIVFSAVDALPIEWNFDTGWVPPGSPLQVQIQSLVAAHTRVHLAGELFTRWLLPDYPGALVFDAVGKPKGGMLSYQYAFLFAAAAKVDLALFNWQGPIPYVPAFDLAVSDELSFDAWGWSPGVSSTQATNPQQIAKYDMTSLFGVSIPGLESGFELDVAVDLEVTWVTDRIVIEQVMDGSGTPIDSGPITGPDVVGSHPVLGGPFVELDVHLEGRAIYDGTLHLIPAFYVKALGNTWSIPVADIPLDFDETTVPWMFDPIRVHVPLPDLEVLDESINFGEVAVGHDRYGSAVLRSQGEAPVYVLISSSDPQAFVPVDAALTIAPESDAAAVVRFVPQREGLHEATLLLDSNDPDAPLRVVTLRGLGLADLEPAGAPSGPVIAEGGCGCRLGPAGAPASPWLALALALAWLGRRHGRAALAGCNNMSPAFFKAN